MHLLLNRQNSILYGEGISRDGCREEEGLIKEGSWASYGEEKIGQGRENAKQYLREHPELLQDIELKIKQKYNLVRTEQKKDNKSKEGA